ncbi:phosphatase PAP2 family protein [Lactococcus insecticola]|nr:phosphatase PAP2 family protein [Lactococcus insecticola]
MKLKKSYHLYASFGLVLFVMLGYLVKFYPDTLHGVDSSVQSAVRSWMSANMTHFFRFVTNFGGYIFVPVIVILCLFFFIFKKWYVEVIFLVGNVIVVALLVQFLKGVYGRTRPSLKHLVVENGLSFPSGHASASIVLYGALMVLICQRLQSSELKWLVRVIFSIIIVLIGLSRIYLGVHFPTDILGGWLLGASLLLATFPFYDEIRFKWRFKGVQR